MIILNVVYHIFITHFFQYFLQYQNRLQEFKLMKNTIYRLQMLLKKHALMKIPQEAIGTFIFWSKFLPLEGDYLITQCDTWWPFYLYKKPLFLSVYSPEVLERTSSPDSGVEAMETDLDADTTIVERNESSLDVNETKNDSFYTCRESDETITSFFAHTENTESAEQHETTDSLLGKYHFLFSAASL